MTIQDQLVSQLDDVLAEFAGLLKRSKYDDISDLPKAEVTRFVSRARQRFSESPVAHRLTSISRIEFSNKVV